MYYCKHIQERRALKSLVFQVGVYTWLPQIWGFGFGSSISRTKLFTNKQFHLFFFSRDEFGNNCLQIACIFTKIILQHAWSHAVASLKWKFVKPVKSYQSNIPLLERHVFFPVSLIDQLQQQPLGTADQEASTTCIMHYKMWCICILRLYINVHCQEVASYFLPIIHWT